MAQLEYATKTSPVYSYTFDAMIAGTRTTSDVKVTVAASALANFKPGCSRILGVELVTAGGTQGTVFVNNLGAQASSTTGFVQQLQIRSTDVADTSTYKVFWVNEDITSQLLTVIPA